MSECGAEVETAGVSGWTTVLALADLPADDAAMVDEIRALEVLACAARARQARLAAALDESQRATQAARGVPAGQRGRGIAEQLAWARRESPHRGRRHLGLATILTSELPHTMAAFRDGRITEWRATVIARETACLSVADRIAVDRAIAGDPDALEEYGDRVVLAELRKLTARLDPAAVAERRRRAEVERSVTIRPAPDVMTYVTALLPVAHGVAVHAALAAEADRLRAAGDPRSRCQLMADTLVARITGAARDGSGRPVTPVSVGLVMTDRALLAGAHDDAHVDGYGPVPAGLARELVLAALDARSRVWLRRLFTSPETGELVAMDSRQRLFRGGLARFVRYRDQFCRSPYCNAAIRHGDHVTPVADGGLTAVDTGQGLCESCNHAKQAPGWRHRPRPGPGHTVDIATPTGHRYRSTAPPLLGPRRGAYRQVTDGLWVLIA